MNDPILLLSDETTDLSKPFCEMELLLRNPEDFTKYREFRQAVHRAQHLRLRDVVDEIAAHGLLGPDGAPNGKVTRGDLLAIVRDDELLHLLEYSVRANQEQGHWSDDAFLQTILRSPKFQDEQAEQTGQLETGKRQASPTALTSSPTSETTSLFLRVQANDPLAEYELRSAYRDVVLRVVRERFDVSEQQQLELVERVFSTLFTTLRDMRDSQSVRSVIFEILSQMTLEAETSSLPEEETLRDFSSAEQTWAYQQAETLVESDVWRAFVEVQGSDAEIGAVASSMNRDVRWVLASVAEVSRHVKTLTSKFS